MCENAYYDLIYSTNAMNRALSRTNINVEALKRRIGNKIYEEHYLSDHYGKELLLIIQNYLIQKYYKKCYLFTKGVYNDDRLFLYSPLKNNDGCCIVGVIDVNKTPFYLGHNIVEKKDMLTAIIDYCYTGFQEIEKQINNSCPRISDDKNCSTNSEITLTLYQLITVGNCMGYINLVLNSDELPDSEKYLMERYMNECFLVKRSKRTLFINKFTGDLILSNDKKVNYGVWCGDDVGKGLSSLIKLMEDWYYGKGTD